MPRILVIDDEADMRQLLTAAFRRAGYEVSETAMGQEGIALARAESPDLVLCDVALLDISGYEVLKTLRGAPETANAAFILITGLADLQGMREGMKLGADDYVPKPFNLDELLALVARRLEKTVRLRHEAEEKARKLRSHISLMLPHELLTSLTGIIELADMLRDDAATLKPQDTAEIGHDIQRAGERLHRLIRNFLIYSQLELLAVDSGRLEALRRTQPSPFHRLVPETAERVAEVHHRRNDLSLQGVTADVAMSETNFGKLCEEILDNAFRYSAPGTPVSLVARLTGPRLWMTITDEGRGIAPEILTTLHDSGQFERLFYEQKSNGLGLAIAIRLAELHGGRLIVQSQPGTGTSVLVELPLAGAK
jgi:signal transduction histidine kinase